VSSSSLLLSIIIIIIIIIGICIVLKLKFTVESDFMAMFLFILRSKRRKHAADVDTVIKHLSELSHTVPPSSLSGGSSGQNAEMLDDFVVQLDQMLTLFPAHRTQVFDNVSTLNHTLQVCFIFF